MQRMFPPFLTNLPLVHQGKTRDTFATKSEDHLLVVATDRLSTHDVVHLSEIPMKGEILTALTIHWLKGVLDSEYIEHHLVAFGRKIFAYLPGTESDYPQELPRRAIIVKKLKMIPREMIWRGYLCGSLYRKFYTKGLPNPYGIDLPSGLPVMARFEEPIFTPTDKSETDDPCLSADVERMYPAAVSVSGRVFRLVREYLNKQGIELIDSKFEIGENDMVADEVCTPDSSRFALLDAIQIGNEPEWLDKQLARNEAQRIWDSDKGPPLEFSERIVWQVSQTYEKVFGMATGMSLREFQLEHSMR